MLLQKSSQILWDFSQRELWTEGCAGGILRGKDSFSEDYCPLEKTKACTGWEDDVQNLLEGDLLDTDSGRTVSSSSPTPRISQFSSVTQLCPTLFDPMNRSTPGLPVHHQLPEFTQTHVHRVSDTIQPSHPLSSPSPPALNPSQHQGLFQWVYSSHEVAKVLEFQL